MVRPGESTTKVVHFEEYGNLILPQEASILSGIYEVHEERGSQQHVQTNAQISDTKIDYSNASQDTCCDAQANPSQLYLRIHYRLWDMVLTSLHTKPDEASIWISTRDDKFLPIHAACQSTSCPSNIVEALMAVRIETLDCATRKDGALPLHLICSNDHFLSQHDALVLQMVISYPLALRTANRHGQTPKEVLERHLNTTNVPNQCRQLLEKFEKILKTPVSPSLHSNNSPDGKHAEPIPKRKPYASVVQSLPSADPSDDGIASRLNKLALMVQDETDTTSIPYRPLSSLDSMVSIKPAKTLRDDDEREYYSPSSIREMDGGVQFREEHTTFDESSFSDDDLPEHLTPRAISRVRLKFSKTTKENSLLRQKISNMTQTLASLQSNHDNQCKRINDLQQSIEKERDVSKSQAKDFDMEMDRIRDELVNTQRQLQSKTLNEQKLAHHVGHLESLVAGKKADVSTLKAAIKQAELNKETVEDELERQRSENQCLAHEVAAHMNDKERLMMKMDEMRNEIESYKDIGIANKTLLLEQSEELEQKSIQCRSLTESMGSMEKKAEKLEKLHSSLKLKTIELRDALKSNTDTYKTAIESLEHSLSKKREDELESIKKCEELNHIIKVKDKDLEQLNLERAAITASFEELQKMEVVGRQIVKQLDAVTVDRDGILEQLASKNEENERLKGEIHGLKLELAQRTGTADETERRIQALYDELVAQRQRETELKESNLRMSRDLDKLAYEEESKGMKLRVLKSAVDSYQREMERFVLQKSADDKMAAEIDQKLLVLEEERKTEAEKVVELKSRLESAMQREKDDFECIRTSKEEATAASSQFKIAVKELEEVRRELEWQTINHFEVSEKLQKLELEYKELELKQESVDQDFKQLQILCTQKIKSEEELRSECTNVRKYNRLQASLIEDLEMNLSEMRTKYAVMHEEHENIRRIAEKRSAFITSQSQQNECNTINALQGTMTRMQEEALLSDEVIVALKNANEMLIEERTLTAQNVAASKVDAIDRLTLINCENLLRIRELSERKDLDMEVWQTEQAAVNLLIKELSGQLDNARHNIGDLCDELESYARASAGDVVDQQAESDSFLKRRPLRNPFKSNDDTIVSNLKREMKKQFESARDKERLHTNCLNEYQQRIESLQEEVKRQNVMHSGDSIALTASFKAYEEKISIHESEVKHCQRKIELLESTISELQSTIGKQNDLITSQTQTTNACHEERQLLKKSVDELTENLLLAQEESRQLPGMAESLQSYRTRNETNVLTIATLEGCLADVRRESDRQRKELKRYQELLKTSENGVASTLSSLEDTQKELETLRKKTVEADEVHKADEESLSLKIRQLETSLAEMQQELEEQCAETMHCSDLSKNCQIEIGRLLKVNLSLSEECQELRAKIKEQMGRTDELLQYKHDYEKQSVESSKKLLDILSKFSPDHVVTDLIEEKEQLQRDHDKLSEDNFANSRNVKYLMSNIQLLESHVMDLTSTHKLLIEETDRLRQTITEMEEQIVQSTDLSDRLAAFNEVGKDFCKCSNISAAYSLEWDNQLFNTVKEFDDDDAAASTGVHGDTSTNSKSVPLEDRATLRERLRQRVTNAFLKKSKELEKLKRQLADIEVNLKEVTSQNHTLKLENKILKTAGKEREGRSNKCLTSLREENDHLKQAISKLTLQTNEHQFKIRRLAAHQASLHRRKAALKLGHVTDQPSKTSVASLPWAQEQLKLDVPTVQSEDMGSLAFSADSQDMMEGTTFPATTTKDEGTTDSDHSVEVILMEDSRDE